MKKLFLGVLTALALAAGGTFAGTLDDVKARGNLLCGVSTGAPGFATVDDSGKDVGFDVDYCRALAAAVFGDPMAVKFVGLTSAVRFTALAAGEVDIEHDGPAVALLVLVGNHLDAEARADLGAQLAGHAIQVALIVGFQEMVPPVAGIGHPLLLVGISHGDGPGEHVAQSQGQAVEQVQEKNPADPARHFGNHFRHLYLPPFRRRISR